MPKYCAIKTLECSACKEKRYLAREGRRVRRPGEEHGGEDGEELGGDRGEQFGGECDGGEHGEERGVEHRREC